MKLLLHIGTPKTGTTSLQSVFYSNRDVLRECKVLYPDLEKTGNHNILSLLFRNNPPPRQYTQDGQRDAAHYEGLVNSALEELNAQIHESRPSTVVLSGEYFFEKLPDAVVSRLKNSLTDQFDEVKIVAYIRHPIDFYVSYAQQVFKASTQCRPPFSLKFRDIIGSYSGHFDVEVIEFSRDKLIGGDTVSDFAARFIPDQSHLLKANRLNQSISIESQSLITAYRKQFLPNSNNIYSDECRRLHRQLQNIERGLKISAKPSLKQEYKREIMKQYASEREFMFTNFGIDFADPVPVADLADQSAQPSKRGLVIEELFDLDENLRGQIMASVMRKLLPS